MHQSPLSFAKQNKVLHCPLFTSPSAMYGQCKGKTLHRQRRCIRLIDLKLRFKCITLTSPKAMLVGGNRLPIHRLLRDTLIPYVRSKRYGQCIASKFCKAKPSFAKAKPTEAIDLKLRFKCKTKFSIPAKAKQNLTKKVLRSMLGQCKNNLI